MIEDYDVQKKKRITRRMNNANEDVASDHILDEWFSFPSNLSPDLGTASISKDFHFWFKIKSTGGKNKYLWN